MLAKLQTAGFYLRRLDNWPAVAAHRLWGRPLREIRFRNGRAVPIDTANNGLGVFLENFRYRYYLRGLSPVPADGVVVDLGANVGMFTLFAALEMVPRGRVIAVEPNPDCLRQLRENLRVSGVAAEVIAAAIAAAPGEVELFLGGDNEHSMLSTLRPTGGRRLRVAAVTVGGLLAELGTVDFLKMDIEGGEYAVFDTTPAEVWSRVRRLGFEFHLEPGQSAAATVARLRARLGELGFAVTPGTSEPGNGYGIMTAERPSAR